MPFGQHAFHNVADMNSPLYTSRDASPHASGRQAGTGTAAAAPRRGSAAVYAQLKAELRGGRLTAWDRLAEEPLAARFGVSRTPVREALTRLLSEGLLEKRNGGIYIALPGFEELAGLYELRVTLELQGLRRALEDPRIRHRRDALQALQDTWSALAAALPEPTPQFVAADESFHVSLLDAAGNQALTGALVSVNDRIRAVRMYDYLTADRISATVTEHLDILDLILADRLRPAFEALHRHIGVSRDVAVERASRAMANLVQAVGPAPP